MNPDELIRTNFLSQLYARLIQKGYSFQSNPDFREFKHGNLKFTDDRITYRTGNNKISITLEHYFIKREGWHPLYWGLQCFDSNKIAIHPDTIPAKETIITKMAAKIQEKLHQRVDLSLVEPKFGWFGWVCFQFSEETSNLDDPLINFHLEHNREILVNRLMNELMVYLTIWEEVIAEIES